MEFKTGKQYVNILTADQYLLTKVSNGLYFFENDNASFTCKEAFLNNNMKKIPDQNADMINKCPIISLSLESSKFEECIQEVKFEVNKKYVDENINWDDVSFVDYWKTCESIHAVDPANNTIYVDDKRMTKYELITKTTKYLKSKEDGSLIEVTCDEELSNYRKEQ